MKKLLFIAALIGTTFTAVGQNTYQEKDPKAKAILDKLSVKHKSIDNIVIDFKATFSGAKIKKQIIIGKAYKAAKKYAYYTSDYTVVNDGRDNWLYSKKDNEVVITSNEDADEGNGLMSPEKLLSIWETGFKYQFIGEGKVGSKMLQEVRLFPVDPKKSKYHTITIIVDKTKNELTKVEIKGRDGVNMVYDITGFSSGTAISGSKFKFDKTKFPNLVTTDNRF